MSPQILIVLILFTLIIISAAYLNQTASFKKEVGLNTALPTDTPTPTVTPFTTLTPTPSTTPTPKPQVSIPDNSGDIRGTSTPNLQYPNSRNIVNDQNEQTFISFDDPQVVTNWYKEKIKEMGLSAKSFVQTKTNGDVLNKLTGSGNGQKVEVEITKDSNQQEVKIKLHVNS